MAKGLCPGVGRSRGIKHEYVNLNERATILLLVYLDNKCLYKKKKKEKCREKRKREREANIPQVTWKTNKALTQDLYRSRRHRASSRGGLENPSGKVSLAGFHSAKSWPWRRRRNRNLLGFRHQKCRVRELEKARFRKITRPALYGNRSHLMRQEGAAVRLVSCCIYPRKQ